MLTVILINTKYDESYRPITADGIICLTTLEDEGILSDVKLTERLGDYFAVSLN